MNTLTLDDRLDAIKGCKVDLTNGKVWDDPIGADCHRPELTILAELEIDHGPCVNVTIGALWGQPMRFLTLTPTEARALAFALSEMADAVEAEITGGTQWK